MWLTVGDRLSASADWGGFTPSEASVLAIVETTPQPKEKLFRLYTKASEWQHVRLFKRYSVIWKNINEILIVLGLVEVNLSTVKMWAGPGL